MPRYTKEEMDLRKQQQDAEDRLKARIIGFGVFAIIAIILLSTAIYSIPAGHRGTVMTFGKVDLDAKDEGIHAKWPIVQTVKKFEVKTQKIEVDADSVSKDLQSIYTTIALNYHLDADSVPRLYQEVGSDFRSRIIDPAIQESVKAITAQYKAEELTDKRPEVSQGIEQALQDRLKKYYITVDDFNIVNFKWSDDYAAAIEQKQVAEQNVLKSQRDLERIKIEAEQVKTQADAEAYSLTIKANAIRQSEDIVILKQIEIQEKAIDKWNGVLPIATGGGSLPFIDITQQGFETTETPTA